MQSRDWLKIQNEYRLLFQYIKKIQWKSIKKNYPWNYLCNMQFQYYVCHMISANSCTKWNLNNAITHISETMH